MYNVPFYCQLKKKDNNKEKNWKIDFFLTILVVLWIEYTNLGVFLWEYNYQQLGLVIIFILVKYCLFMVDLKWIDFHQ